jgi:signal transduction histidine kinase
VQGLDFKLLFERAPGPFLVLQPDPARFAILAVTDAYLSATHTMRDGILGRGLFEVFPDNPDDPAASGTANLRASLLRVIERRTPDTMAVQKYDIARPQSAGGGFEERFWSPINSPVCSPNGELLYILHRVEDVTEYVHLTQAGAQARETTDALQRRTESMEADILRRSRELDDANKRLRVMNSELAELDQAKTSFFNNISHEFRTPLTLMLGPIEDALQDQDDALKGVQRERIELVRHNSLRLHRLVNSLLDFSRVEAGRVQACYVPTDASALTAELASMFGSVFARAGLRLHIECAPLSQPAYLDRDMWEKIVLNLVSNAFKFTLAGGVEVRVREASGRFELTVADTGTGIPEHELPRIFDRFHRVQGAQARSHEGTGIGLALVRELVRLHGGTVTVQSELGRGTTFTITVPVGKAHLSDDQATAPAGASASAWQGALFAEEAARWLRSVDAAVVSPTHGADGAAWGSAEIGSARVLVVDDNADLRAYLQTLLSPFYVTEVAVDGASALIAAQTRPPDLVVSDLMMPNLDGFGLLRALRTDPRTRDIPFILLSARAGEDCAIDGLHAGADDYVDKPFSARELLARVRTHLDLSRARRHWAGELQRANDELEAFSYSVAHDLRAPLRAIDGFSKALLSEHGAKLNAQGVHYLERVRAGTQRMSQLIDDLLELSRINRTAVHDGLLDLSEIASGIVLELRRRDPARDVIVELEPGLTAKADKRLLAIALENLLGNAWKFTSKRAGARISFGSTLQASSRAFFVRDNGAGFDMDAAQRLFSPFYRMHKASDFDGTGIGLAIVQRVVARHGGRIWAEAKPDHGATFYFTLGETA